jgi:N-hydroxyarylamine O-acetyltransferase
MTLQHYFDRIGFAGPANPDPGTLQSLLQAHVQAVPFENLDVQFGKKLTTAVRDAYRKIVEDGRGGWCYEQNGLFGWALSEIGFDVTRVAAAVMRQERGDAALDNHLCLLVRCPDLDRTWLADVGFGGGLFGPIPLEETDHRHEPCEVGLRLLTDGWWRFRENFGDGDFSFDFAPVPADEKALSSRCDALQTDPDSIFVLNLVAQIREPDRHLSLRGRVLRVATAEGISNETLDSAGALRTVLAERFRLDVPEIVSLWPRIIARHTLLFGEPD